MHIEDTDQIIIKKLDEILSILKPHVSPVEISRPVPYPKTEATIPASDQFKALCYLMVKSEHCKEEFKKPLMDFQGRTMLTEKQYKFFSVMHKEILGKWPPRELKEGSPSTALQPTPIDLNDDTIPF